MTPARSFAEVVRGRAERDPDGELVRLVGGEPWSAARFYLRSEALAGGLARVVRPGDAVVTAVEPGPETIALSCALSLLGAVEVALAEGVDATFARRVAATTGSVLAVASPARFMSDAAVAALTELSPFGVVLTHAAHLFPAEITLDALAERRRPLPQHEPDLGSAALVIPTSGTTGRPKAAVLPNGAGLGQARRVQRAMAYGKDDVLFSFFPWQHINARHAAFLPAAMSGARLVVQPRFPASTFWETAVQEGMTAFNFMGAVCAMLLRREVGPLDRAHTINRAYGGPAPAWMVEDMADRFGVQLRQAYACTELGDVATTDTDVRPGAAGRPVPEYDVEVRDERGETVSDGEPGELVVRPREEHLTFTGYAGDREATSLAWRDGWFHTGDQVRLDEGWLFFEGRSADVIRRRGLNISAANVEEAVARFPGVAEVAAVGVPSELTEEDVLVIVVAGPGEVDPAALHRHCQSLLPRHAVPRYVSIESSIPLNSSLKVLRAHLRERGLPPSAWDADQHLTAT